MKVQTARPRLFVLLLGVCSIATGCRPDGAPPPAKDGVLASAVEAAPAHPTELQLALNWFPEAEHGGYFAALMHGYYKEAGLAVKILPGGPNAPVIQRVAGKQVAFGVENADRVLLGRAQEANVVALMAPIQKSPRAIMVHHKSGIKRIEDLANVTLAVNSGAAWVQYLKKRVPLKNVRFVPYTGNVAQFLANENYAQQAYVFSEPFVAQQKGAEPDCLLVAETGYNPYTSLLVTNEELLTNQPEIVRKFVAASIRGWQTYLAEPDSTNRYLHEINPEMSPEILAYGVKALGPLCVDRLPDAGALGQMTAERWKTLLGQLVEANVIAADAVDPARAFTTEFLR
jgi:NitT/TauT family transport system substrate-binding protein